MKGIKSEYFPSPELVAECEKVAKETGAVLEFIEDATVATKGAHVIYTDVWVSMGEPAEVWEERIKALSPYAVTSDIMKNAAEDVKEYSLHTTNALGAYFSIA